MPTNSEILARVPLFRNVGPEGLEHLGAVCSRKTLAKGEILFLEGVPADCLYVVVSGRLRIERTGAEGQTQVLGFRAAGEVVGEMGLLDSQPRSAQATASSACRLLSVHGRDFERVVLAQPGVALGIMRTLASRLREAGQQAIDRRSKDVGERLLDLLTAEADESGRTRSGTSQSTWADVLGCTRETVNRALAKLEFEGKLQRSGRSVVVSLGRSDRRRT
ncbi:MAG: Crp/Fnr family transcriptional regulator [Armatimonadetes bacterium]|nr:Crp/Fnr family transcriptional regulator [Armatimonadota bacterium]